MTPTTATKSKLNEDDQAKLEEAWLLIDELIEARKEVPVDGEGRPVPDEEQTCAFFAKVLATCVSLSELADDQIAMSRKESHETSTPFMKIRNIIHELSIESNEPFAPEEDILQRAAELDISSADANKLLGMLHSANIIYVPRAGTYALV